MVTDCFSARTWDISDTEAVFLQGTLSLLKVILPVALVFLVLRICVANKSGAHQNISVLRLNETSTDT